MMVCSHCGKMIDPNYKFCPLCGELQEKPILTEQAKPISESERPIINKKKMPIWFKCLIFLAVAALIFVTGGILFTESLVDVVDDQLKAFRRNDVENAYLAFTSKDFQAATSLDQFRNFIHAYPIFINNHSAHFYQRSIEHNVGTLKGTLTSNDHVLTAIEYKIIKEDGKWKILSIRLLKPEAIQNAQEANYTEDLIKIVKSQLKDIQNHKFSNAYQDYASKEFKEVTSEQAFEDFIKRYPVLADHHIVSFHKPSIRNGVGTLSAILQSKDVAAYVKYYLIYEDENWRIWSMRILSPSEEQEKNKSQKTSDSDSDSMRLGSILLG